MVVSFADPAQYADAPRFGSSDAVVRGIAAHLQDLGERYLPAGATLRIEVLDLEILGCFWFSITSLLLILGLLAAQRRMREPL